MVFLKTIHCQFFHVLSEDYFLSDVLSLKHIRSRYQMTGGSLWGAPAPVSSAMSLAEIQQQEERERKQREIQLHQQLQAQQREQQARGAPGWADRPPTATQPVKSLIQIQQEQARQLDKRQQPQGQALSRSQVGWSFTILSLNSFFRRHRTGLLSSLKYRYFRRFFS